MSSWRPIFWNSWFSLGAALLLWAPGTARSQVELLPGGSAQAVFSGIPQNVSMTFHNTGRKSQSLKLRTRLYQASSATAVPLGLPRDWKQLQVLPGQTVLETLSLTFPTAETGSRFLVQCLDENNKALGAADLMVYPTNLLKDLGMLAGGLPLGIFDPQNRLQPLLQRLHIAHQDLKLEDFKKFTGRLVIVRSTATSQNSSEQMADRIAALAQGGAAVVWIQPDSDPERKKEFPMFGIHLGRSAVSVLPAKWVSDLDDSPLAQLNLIWAAELALKPDQYSLLNVKP